MSVLHILFVPADHFDSGIQALRYLLLAAQVLWHRRRC